MSSTKPSMAGRAVPASMRMWPDRSQDTVRFLPLPGTRRRATRNVIEDQYQPAGVAIGEVEPTP